jgi:uncharacterized repeat protein (TIGR01451 family)
MRITKLWWGLGAGLIAVMLVFTVASAQGSKEQMYSEMLSIAEQMRALKPLIQASPEAEAQYATLEARYRSLSDQMGGDDPASALGNAPQDLRAGRARAPRVAPPAPPGCTTSATNVTNSTPVPIPDNTTVMSTINVAVADTYLLDLDVTTNITHTFASDLDITLTSPAGTISTLTTDNGGSNDNVFNGTLWDDFGGATNPPGAITDTTFANNVVETPLVDEEAMGAFIGQNPNGTWTLTITDDLGGDTGTLNSWSLNLTTLPSAPMTATTSATNNTPVVIVDNMTVTSTQMVSGAGAYLCDMNLTTFITHTWAGDLDITLTSPLGTISTLTTDNGGSNDNVFNGTLWDDFGGATNPPGAITDTTFANNVVETPLVAEEAMGAFVGENAVGIWTLSIGDDAGGDTGTLNSWTLDATTCFCGAPVLTISKTVDNPGPVLSGDILTYTIDVDNTGNAAATNVVVLDPVPAMTTYVPNSCTTSQGTCSLNGANVEFLLGTMNPATMATLTFQVQVDPAPLPPGQICNQGYTVDSDQTAPVTGAPVCVVLVPAELMEFESPASEK